MHSHWLLRGHLYSTIQLFPAKRLGGLQDDFLSMVFRHVLKINQHLFVFFVTKMNVK